MCVGANLWSKRASLAERSSQRAPFPHTHLFVLVISSDNAHCSGENGWRRMWPAPGSVCPADTGAALPQLLLSPVSRCPMVRTQSWPGRDPLHQRCPWGSTRKSGISSASISAPALPVVTPPSGLSSEPSFATQLWHLTHSPSDSSPVPLPPHAS